MHEGTKTAQDTVIENTHETHDVVGFTDEASAPPQDLSGKVTTPLSQMDYTRSIKQFLRRPTKTAIHTFTGAAVPLNMSPLTQPSAEIIYIPGDCLAVGERIPKIRNFHYFTATTVIKGVCNASRFTSGKLAALYAPLDTLQFGGNKLEGNLTLVRASTCPIVEIDVQGQTTFELKIPFCSYKAAYDLNHDDFAYATFFLVPITPIHTPDGKGVEIVLYSWFEDVVLTGVTVQEPADANLSPMEKKFKEFRIKQKEFPKVEVDFQILPNNDSPILKNNFPTSTSVTQLLTETIIPLFPNLDWVKSLYNASLDIFGFGKPPSTNHVCSVANLPAYGLTHSRGIDNSVTIAAIQDNSLKSPFTSSFSNMDEMQLSYIAKKPAIIGVFPIKTTDKMDDIIFSEQVTPSFMFASKATIDTRPHYMMTPAQFLTTMFRYWHGTMCYKLSFAKTALHNCRVRVTYTTDWEAVQNASDVASNLYSNVLDLTTDTEITIRIPYIGNNLYKANYSVDYASDVSIGVIQLSIETPLIAPDTVDQQIEVVLWTWMEDAEFSIPEKLGAWRVMGDKGPGPTNKLQTIVASNTVRLGSLERYDLNFPIGLNDMTTLTVFGHDVDTPLRWTDFWFEQPPDGTTFRIYTNHTATSYSTITFNEANLNFKGAGNSTWAYENPGAELDKVADYPAHTTIRTDGSKYTMLDLFGDDSFDLGDKFSVTINNVTYNFVRDWVGQLVSADDASAVEGIALPVGTQFIQQKSTNFQISIEDNQRSNEFVYNNNTENVNQGIERSKNTIGERIVNLRELSRMNRRISTFNTVASTRYNFPRLAQYETTDYSLLRHISFIFRFWRGSLIRKIFNFEDPVKRLAVYSSIRPTQETSFSQLPFHVTYTDLNPIHETRVPFYCQYEHVPTNVSSEVFSDLNLDHALPDHTFQTSVDSTLQIYQSAGDDFSFQFFIGPPPMYYLTQ